MRIQNVSLGTKLEKDPSRGRELTKLNDTDTIYLTGPLVYMVFQVKREEISGVCCYGS